MAKGRDFTRQALQDWGWDGTETSEDTLLLVSELLTNASLHSNGCRELVLTADGATLRIEVHDGTTAIPVHHSAPQPGIPGGHGLHIVERLSDRWGTHTYGDGKAVWAEIETPARSSRPARTPTWPQQPAQAAPTDAQPTAAAEKHGV
ncbi:ATP-binding protein [Streptomyces erythrochromogenes]|uniref:ATP-binding protein n=1 Tax=Streptomyces erythrochromogenes TaxID=285574 RepID=UPI0036B30F81